MKSALSKYSAFLKSPHHAWLGLLTLGAGIASVSLVGVIAGLAAYGLGWIYFPDSGFFGKWLEKQSSEKSGDVTRKFLLQRRMLYDGLSAEGKADYGAVAKAAEELRVALGADGRLPAAVVVQRSERLAQFVWTYLRLVHTGESLRRLLDSEDAGDLKKESEALGSELDGLRGAAVTAGSSADRLIESKSSRLESLRQRLIRHEEAAASLELTLSEKARIVDLLKLMRADHLASRDANLLSHEIDGTAMELDRTRDWLRDLEFDSTPSDVPDAVAASAPLEISSNGPGRRMVAQ